MANNQDEIIEIPMNKIKLGANSRLYIQNDALVGLMQSVKERGMLQPPVVIKNDKGGYDLVAGRRRFLVASKLNWSKIKCSVRTTETAKDLLIDNLTENVQRSDISLVEVGRYIEKLRKEDMSSAEIAVRLGVTKSYVDTASKAYNEVPKEFQKALVMTKGNERPKPGQLPVTTAKAIINARKSYRLTAKEVNGLFKAALSDDKFQSQQILKYAQAIKAGKKNFTKAVKPMRTLAIQAYITEDHYNELRNKHIENGPFSSMSELVLAILSGKKAVKIDARARR